MKESLIKGQRGDFTYAVIANFSRDKKLNGLTVPQAAKLLRGSDSIDDQIETVRIEVCMDSPSDVRRKQTAFWDWLEPLKQNGTVKAVYVKTGGFDGHLRLAHAQPRPEPPRGDRMEAVETGKWYNARIVDVRSSPVSVVRWHSFTMSRPPLRNVYVAVVPVQSTCVARGSFAISNHLP